MPNQPLIDRFARPLRDMRISVTDRCNFRCTYCMPKAHLHPGEVASRWRHTDGGGEVGVIASVSKPFYGGCNRIRMSAEGKLHSCLFSDMAYDLRALLRADESDENLVDFVTETWQRRSDRYSELRYRTACSTAKAKCRTLEVKQPKQRATGACY